MAEQEQKPRMKSSEVLNWILTCATALTTGTGWYYSHEQAVQQGFNDGYIRDQENRLANDDKQLMFLFGKLGMNYPSTETKTRDPMQNRRETRGPSTRESRAAMEAVKPNVAEMATP